MSFGLKKWVLFEALNLILWLVVFCLINWLATDNLWLCFFVTAALMTSFSSRQSKEILETLLPVHRDIDRCLNELKEKNDQLEVDIDELRVIIKRLNVKVGDLEFPLNSVSHKSL